MSGLGELVAMFPIADVTPNLPVGSGVALTIDGNYAMLGSGGSISKVVSMNDASVINFERPFIGNAYRNNIPAIGWNGVQFCGLYALKPPGTSRDQFLIADGKTGKYLYQPRFNNLWPPDGGLIQDEAVDLMTLTLANNWTGVITSPTANLNPSQPHNLLGPIAFGANDTVGSPHGYEIDTGGPSYVRPEFVLVIGASVPGNEWGWLGYHPTYGVFKIQEFTGESIPVYTDTPKIMQPICNTLEGFVADPTQNNFGTMGDAGPFRNYCFQSILGNDMAICGIDQGGTAVDKTTGQVNHSLSVGPVGFDVSWGRGRYYQPLFPPTFTLDGTTYSFGASDGKIQAMSIVGQNIAAIVEYNDPVSSNILLAGGLALNITKFDTLNWKRSLTYGMRGPGIPGFFGDEPTPPQGAKPNDAG